MRAKIATALVLAGAFGLAACSRTAPPVPQGEPRYVVGQPYEMGGVWSYPREDFALVETGLAIVSADTRAGRRTANGEVHDPSALMAAHRTLQLPAVLRVKNLETGREIQVRLNDRGPAKAGRVLELSRRAAELLGVQPGGTAQVRLTVEPEPSRALAGNLPGTENAPLQIEAAPVARIETERLAPLPGSRVVERVRSAAPARIQAEAVQGPPQQSVPLRLPEQVWQGAPEAGRLVAEGSSFSRRDLAQRQAARLAQLGARVEAFWATRTTQNFRVRVGPFASVQAADAALEAMLRAGVADARLLID